MLEAIRDAAKAAAGLPECPVHGAYTTRHQVLGVWRTLRTMCPCQEAAHAEREAEARRASALTEWTRQVWGVLGEPALVRQVPGFPQAVEACGAYVATWHERKASGQGLYLWGGVGVGKTTALRHALHELTERHQARVLCLSQPELAEVSRDFQGDRAKRAVALVQLADVLLLDDLGTGKLSRWGADVLWRCVEARRAHGLPILSTSNLDPAGLQARWARELAQGVDGLGPEQGDVESDRIVSRLLEGCDVVELKGEDRRVQEGVVWLSDRRKE